MIGAVQDVTERKEAELALVQSKHEQERYTAQLETVFNNLSDGLVVADLEGMLFQWNPAALAMHGFENPDEARRRFPELASIFELSTPQDGILPLERWPLARVLRGESLHLWEVHIRRRQNGWRRIFSYGGTLARDREGIPLLAVVIVRDITERKKREEEFVRISQQNELILEYAGEGIFGLDLQGKVTFVNARAAHMLGYHRSELMGSHSHSKWQYQRADGSPYPSRECPIYAAYDQGSTRSGEEVFWRKDGTAFPVDFTSRPLYEAGRIAGAVVVYRDITERKRAEEELKRLVNELERSNKELEQFAYVASHDLQEPLRMVASYVQLLQRRYKAQLDEKADRYIFFAVDGVQRMQKLIDGLLAYSRVSRGAKFSRVKMNLAYNEAVMNLSVAIREAGAIVTREELPEVTGDETQLIQVFQNLIGNAIKFTVQDRAPRVHVTAARSGGEDLFSVTDNGIGIDPQYAQRIFLIFQRLHSREEYAGTGIGLSLCKRIIERHGGRIWMESAPGRGTTFTFSIPRRD
jgi:PAS domain S-box-containing protein